MCGSLGKMAREQGYEFGAYLLEMAYLEFTKQQELAEQNASLRQAFLGHSHSHEAVAVIKAGLLFIRWHRMNVRH